MRYNVLIIGSGGREHCLAWKISQSPHLAKLFCAPGNGGTASIAQNVAISADDIEALCDFAAKEKIDVTIVGPEVPLVAGIVDAFDARGLHIFGPKKDLALLEGSKIFAKKIMQKYGIPTARFKAFDDPDAAKQYIDTIAVPCVIKADGLAAGKGVIIAQSHDEAKVGIDFIMVQRRFGDAGSRVVIEECLKGEEASILIFSDGEHIIPLVSSQDHKRIFENDCGPNTGGMGAYAPAPVVSDEVLKRVLERIGKPLIHGLKKDSQPYKGILYIGLMIDGGEPFVLEFNVRFGDPETQAILPKLKSDLMEVILAALGGKLDSITLEWDKRSCMCVVLASGGYPGSYDKGKEISGLDDVDDAIVFHAGTSLIQDGSGGKKLVTSGGRVLGVTALGLTLREAQAKAYQETEKIYFEKMYCRKDIGNKALYPPSA